MKTATIGTVSHGTLRDVDLIDAFASELRRLRGSLPRAIWQGVQEFQRNPEESEDSSELVQELCDALQEFALPYCYFGTHPGDGSDFGFWPEDVENIRESVDLEVSDTGDIPADFSGDVLHVNERGNCTFYVKSGPRAKLREVWAIV